jgi:predicted secreted Zn-dependent protease
VKNYLQRFIPGYQESTDVFGDLVNRIAQAITRAQSGLKDHPAGKQRFPNPSTYVYELAKELIEMSQSGREHLLNVNSG